MRRTTPTKEKIEPVPEKHKGQNHPYRGAVDHGVPDEGPAVRKPLSDTVTVPVMVDEPEEQHPIPVRIVEKRSGERRDHRAGTTTVNNVRSTIVNQNDRRSSVTIINESDAVAIRIGDETVSLFSGYRVGPGKEVLNLKTHNAVWAVSEDGTDVAVSWLAEFSVEI
jgi:hypothetical protein